MAVFGLEVKKTEQQWAKACVKGMGSKFEAFQASNFWTKTRQIIGLKL